MGDRLEGFVAGHRPEFDDGFKPSKELWKRIDKELGSGYKRNYNIWWKVAAVLFLASTVLLVLEKIRTEPQEAAIQNNRFVEFENAERYYTEMIDEKRLQIGHYDNPQLVAEFEADLEKLDVLYGELKKTFNDKGNDDQMIDAMINNLQLRLQILNSQIEVLERLKTYEQEDEVQSI